MQMMAFERFCKQLNDLNRDRMYNLEMKCLDSKHSLKRSQFVLCTVFFIFVGTDHFVIVVKIKWLVC